MLPRLVIFDLDGTLLDTVEDVACCFNQALRESGFPERSLREVVSLVGGDLETIVGRLLPEGAPAGAVDAVKASYRAAYAASEKPRTHPYEGIPELLAELERLGVSIAVNTNKGQDLAEACLAKLLPGLECPVVGYVEGLPPKPDPSGARRLLEIAGCAASEAAYVGDGTSDALTARNAGVQFVFCSWGQGDEAGVRAVASDMLVAHDVAQLGALLTGEMQDERA